MRPAKGDELDKFLAKMEDPDDWYDIYSFLFKFIYIYFSLYLSLNIFV